jgi:hypothetical protein
MTLLETFRSSVLPFRIGNKAEKRDTGNVLETGRKCRKGRKETRLQGAYASRGAHVTTLPSLCRAAVTKTVALDLARFRIGSRTWEGLIQSKPRACSARAYAHVADSRRR